MPQKKVFLMSNPPLLALSSVLALTGAAEVKEEAGPADSIMLKVGVADFSSFK
jgi:hypothetical protein